jgi:hypothetical protein
MDVDVLDGGFKDADRFFEQYRTISNIICLILLL